MADGLRRLLTYIVEHPVMEIESREAEMDASAVSDIPAELASISEDRLADADKLSSYFAEGIKRAAMTNGKITVEDTDPVGNGIADSFARFLVTTNLATSQSEETGDNHYRYTFEIDWPRLGKIAERAGVNLDDEVRGK